MFFSTATYAEIPNFGTILWKRYKRCGWKVETRCKAPGLKTTHHALSKGPKKEALYVGQ